MKSRVGTRTARLIALSMAIQEQLFDPQSVNMSDIAKVIGVNRSTILKDFAVLNSVFDEAREMQAKLRNAPPTISHRKGKV